MNIYFWLGLWVGVLIFPVKTEGAPGSLVTFRIHQTLAEFPEFSTTVLKGNGLLRLLRRTTVPEETLHKIGRSKLAEFRDRFESYPKSGDGSLGVLELAEIMWRLGEREEYLRGFLNESLLSSRVERISWDADWHLIGMLDRVDTPLQLRMMYWFAAHQWTAKIRVLAFESITRLMVSSLPGLRPFYEDLKKQRYLSDLVATLIETIEACGNLHDLAAVSMNESNARKGRRRVLERIWTVWSIWVDRGMVGDAGFGGDLQILPAPRLSPNAEKVIAASGVSAPSENDDGTREASLERVYRIVITGSPDLAMRSWAAKRLVYHNGELRDGALLALSEILGIPEIPKPVKVSAALSVRERVHRIGSPSTPSRRMAMGKCQSYLASLDGNLYF